MAVTRDEEYDQAHVTDSMMFHGVLPPEVARDHYRLMNTPSADSPVGLDTPTGADTPKSEPKGRRRGRPRIHESEEMANDKRKRQIRLAQRAHRSRKEEKMLFLETRVAELETKMSDIRRLCLNLSTAFDTGILPACPSLLQPLQNDLLQLLSLSEPAPQANNMPNMDSAQMMDGDNLLDLSWDDALFSQNELRNMASPVPSDEYTNSVFWSNGHDQIYLNSFMGGNDLGINPNLQPGLQTDISLHGSNLTWA
ncbi:hypothetical protein P170DRAFT_460232 [Aspergillus steynii IBT 23096]|uniref:BZIP domain-containing protein n=1 Tax=Aspergillus steynii IBT 23096 TaxID=1392250 RepID=A0A2I2GM27_9EURO|nr:uncharacterized protein P170DRAFT_460232 [Aspergillus steynii IBT 23096]PLB53932.1 hypothetical protein P170DRAFT_460232 [Aspergillus steynii IBT 23096]